MVHGVLDYNLPHHHSEFEKMITMINTIVNGTKTGKAYVEAQEYFSMFLYRLLTELPVLFTTVIAGLIVLYLVRRLTKK